MDRVQDWRIRGDLERLPGTLEAVIRAHRRVRRVRWDPSGDKLIAKTSLLDLTHGPEKITLKIEARSTDYWDVTVCSESGPFDYGANMRNLDQIRRAIVEAGFAVEGSAVRRSWRRSSRP
jgi:hypothetical protein